MTVTVAAMLCTIVRCIWRQQGRSSVLQDRADDILHANMLRFVPMLKRAVLNCCSTLQFVGLEWLFAQLS